MPRYVVGCHTSSEFGAPRPVESTGGIADKREVG